MRARSFVEGEKVVMGEVLEVGWDGWVGVGSSGVDCTARANWRRADFSVDMVRAFLLVEGWENGARCEVWDACKFLHSGGSLTCGRS